MGLEKVETGVELAEGLAILLLLLYAAKKLQAPITNAAAATKQVFLDAGIGPTVTGTAPFVGSIASPGKALTPGQADGIAKFIGIAQHGGGYNVSPDGTQVWFYDGSFFDNTTGHYFNSAGQDQGDLLGGGPTLPDQGGQVTTDPVIQPDFSLAM